MNKVQSPPKSAGTILIVDDESSIFPALTEILSNLSFEVCTASSSQEALDILGVEDIDLLLTDIMMSEIRGFDFVEQVNQEWPEVQCLVISTLFDQQTVITAVQLGVVNFLRKPVGAAELTVAVLQAMAKRRLLREVAETKRALAESQSGFQAIVEKARVAEEASRTKSEFLANMSHELRSPLNAIMVLSRLLAENEDGVLGPEHVEMADTVFRSGSELLVLINDILDLSKVEAGRLELEFEVVDLMLLLKEFERQYQPLAQEKNLSFVAELCDDDCRDIFVDSLRLNQIIRNFISNALKFTNQGEVFLKVFRPAADTVFSDNQLLPAETIAFSVSDTGIGIPPDKLDFIFESFTQADSSTTRRFGGTGLGLTIARELARLLGGEIQVASTEGRGSVFTLYIPDIPDRHGERSNTLLERRSSKRLSDQDQGAEVRRQGPQTVELSKGAQTEIRDVLAGRKVLVVDDDMRNVFTLIAVLQQQGVKVVAAANGGQALEKLAQEPDIDLVLLDVMMPDMDGYEVCRRIRNPATSYANVPVITVTAKAMPGDLDKCLAAGANAYIPKPFNAGKLLQEMAKQLFRAG
jgi:signal transduction histidine kinase